MDTASMLFLLLTKDSGKPEKWGTQTGWALTAAAVADLLLAERLTLGEEKDPRVHVVDPTPTGNPTLDPVLARAVHKDGRRLSSLVQDRKADPEQAVVDGLVADSVVEVEAKRFLGLVPEKHPVLDPAPEREVRERLRTVLRGGRPLPTDATLLAILDGLGIARAILADEGGDLSSRQLERRIEEATQEVAVGDAVRRAVDALNAVVMTTAILPAVTTTT